MILFPPPSFHLIHFQRFHIYTFYSGIFRHIQRAYSTLRINVHFEDMPKRKAADCFNPVSKYEEFIEVEGLTLWSINRPPWKKVLKSDNAPPINVNSLSLSEFKVSQFCVSFRNHYIIAKCVFTNFYFYSLHFVLYSILTPTQKVSHLPWHTS